CRTVTAIRSSTTVVISRPLSSPRSPPRSTAACARSRPRGARVGSGAASASPATSRARPSVPSRARASRSTPPATCRSPRARSAVRRAPAPPVNSRRVVQAALLRYTQPGVVTPDFDATAYHRVPTVTSASAVHVAVVDVDRDTGAVKRVRYVVAHDCGNVINPSIVDGQVHGGVAQGVGGALFEDMAYDAEGQLLAGSLMDYAVPVASDLPAI